MLKSQIPTRMGVYWASGAADPTYVRTVPVNSQIGIQDGAGSFVDGFPPLTMLAEGAGGVPPFGQDMNGAIRVITQWLQWAQAGAPITWDSAFALAVGGYPQGAVLRSTASVRAYWLSLVDNNMTNPDAAGAGWIGFSSRTVLSADVTFYIATTGNDSNDGSSGSPWATIQHAWNVVQEQYDLAGYKVTLSCADNTFSGGLVATGLLVGGVGAGALTLRSGSGNASACIINSASQSPIEATDYAAFTVANIGLVSANRDLLHAHDHATIYCSGLDFGATSNTHLRVGRSGVIEVTDNYTISGSAAGHYLATRNGTINVAAGITATLSGTPAFSGGFAQGTNGGLLYCVGPTPITFSGAATGSRYVANMNGVINTNAAVTDPNFFPGSSAGSTATGGQYA